MMKYNVQPVTINFRNYVSGYFLCTVRGYLSPNIHGTYSEIQRDLSNRLYYISSKYQSYDEI